MCAQQTYSSGIQARTRSVHKHGAPSDGSCELRGNGKAEAAWWSLGVWSLASSPAPCRRCLTRVIWIHVSTLTKEKWQLEAKEQIPSFVTKLPLLIPKPVLSHQLFVTSW